MKIAIYYFGKPRDAHLNAYAQEFVKRAARYVNCEMRQVEEKRFDPWAQFPKAGKVLLDVAGRRFSSEDFAGWVARAQERAWDQIFVIGGAEGLCEEWKSRADLLLSLSPLTFSHELARAILAEQIYRALARLHNHPYARPPFGP
jgi:23S rRNA (pseudouridine1915-N3)-methyltransferase